MDFFKKYTIPFGCVTNGSQIDKYGIDHSTFSTRDELEYQFARQEREKQLADILNRQGFARQDYPQPHTGFRRNNPQNNYGVCNSDIHNNTEKQPQQTVLLKQFGNNFGNVMVKYGINKIMTSLHNLGYDAVERAYDYLYDNSKNLNEYDNLSSVGKAQAEAYRLTPVQISDVDKHRYVSCIGAFDGPFTAAATGVAGILKEGKDLYKKWNNPCYGTNIEIIQDSLKDLKNNALGITKGLSSSDINQCSEILPQNARKQLF